MRKKRMGVLIVIMIMLVLNLQVCATGTRLRKMNADLLFYGTTANCTAYVRADSGSDEIVAMMRLWDSGTCLRTWRSTGKGSVNLEESYAVSRGKTYRLTLDVTINGRVQPTQSTSKTCN